MHFIFVLYYCVFYFAVTFYFTVRLLIELLCWFLLLIFFFFKARISFIRNGRCKFTVTVESHEPNICHGSIFLLFFNFKISNKNFDFCTVTHGYVGGRRRGLGGLLSPQETTL